MMPIANANDNPASIAEVFRCLRRVMSRAAAIYLKIRPRLIRAWDFSKAPIGWLD
jgi:hypothetical protein